MPFPVISRCMRQLNIIRDALKAWPSESTESRLQPSVLDSRVFLWFPLLREHAMLPIRQKGWVDTQIDVSIFNLNSLAQELSSMDSMQTFIIHFADIYIGGISFWKLKKIYPP